MHVTKKLLQTIIGKSRLSIFIYKVDSHSFKHISFKEEYTKV